MSKTYEQIVAELDSKIPRDVISQRDGGNGRSLSYLEGHYVIDRLNKILGVGKWAYGAELTKVFEGTVKDRYDNDVFNTSYIAKVRMVVTIGSETKEVTTEFIDVGYGDGSDKKNPGKAHELAVKEAVTDGIKRCAKNLGMSMGLALYDKTQENVEDVQETKANTTTEPKASAETSRPSRPATFRQVASKSAQKTEATPTNSTDATSTNKAANSRVYGDIATASRVAIAKKKATQETLTGLVAKYGVKSKEELTETQATELLTTIRSML